MSMYAMVAGDGNQYDRGAALLALLGNPDPGRFRDAWVEKSPETDDPIIAIYTRNGGGNRESCEGVIDDLQAHPLYIRDADDDFDCTYATFYFRAPDDHRAALADIAGDPVDTDARWMAVIAALGAK